MEINCGTSALASLVFFFDDGSSDEEDEEEGGGIAKVFSCFLLLLLDLEALIAPEFGSSFITSNHQSAIGGPADS
jgi:hypothetical protein